MAIDAVEELRRQSEDKLTYEDILDKWRYTIGRSNVLRGSIIRMLASSSTISNNSNLTLSDVSEICTSGSVTNYTGSVLDLCLIFNSNRLSEYFNSNLLLKTPITEDFIKESYEVFRYGTLHGECCDMNGGPSVSYRFYNNKTISSEENGMDFRLIHSSIEALCLCMDEVDESATLRAASTCLQYFESIKPFLEGNTMFSIWLINYFLLLNNHPPIILNISDRQKYQACLNKFNAVEDVDSMFELLKKNVVNSYKYYSYLI